MASPQTENGYTKIANELLEALCRERIGAHEFSVVLWVARQSYGWSARKTKPLGLRQMAREMNRPQASICLAVQVLIEKRVLIRDEKGRYAINKDYESWINAAQPIGQKVPNPLGTLPNPLGTLPNPLGKTAQPIGQFHDEPKERKKVKESVKGEIAQNGDTHKPTLAEIKAYAAQIGKAMNCDRFFDHYQAKGWARGKAPIVDWKAVVRLWEEDGAPTHSSSRAPVRPKICERCGEEPAIVRESSGVWIGQQCQNDYAEVQRQKAAK